jgi:integrase
MIGSGRRHSIGRVGEITLAQARSAATRIKAEMTLGRHFPETVTISSAKDKYLAQAKIRSTTREYYERHLARLPDRAVADIKPFQINAILDELPTAARTQALASFRAFFNWCISRNYLDHSPCQRIKASQSTKRDRVLTDQEISAIWHACDSCGRFGRILRLLILTGARKNEIARMERSWVRENQMVIPKEVSKNGREHIIPLTVYSRSLILAESATAINTNSSYLFAARGNSNNFFNGWSKSKVALDRKLNIDPWTIHDLRRTFATNTARLGVRLEVTERLLNHVSGSLGGIVGVYQRHDFHPEMREAVERYENWLSNLLTFS